MGNERLRSQLIAKGLSADDLAARMHVDPKTVERWIKPGRVPRARHRREVCMHLEADEAYLWPSTAGDPPAMRAAEAELVAIYPQRSAVPLSLWRELLADARENVDVLVFAGLFFLDGHSDVPQVLREKSSDGLKARLLYGDPAGSMIQQRGDDEGIGADLAARVRIALSYLKDLEGSSAVEVRLHDTVLYNSIYRFDDQMLINTHVLGSPAPKNPVLHLHRTEGGRLFDTYLQSFDYAWADARPLAGLERP